MTEIDAAVFSGTYGAKLQSWRQANPRNLLARIVASRPSLSEQEHADLFWREVQTDEDMLKVICLCYWYPNNYRSMFAPPHPQQATKHKAKEIAKKAIRAGIKREAKRLLLDTVILPNGKTLRKSSGRDCKRAGGLFSKIATLLKPNEIVGDVLSEAEVRKHYR